MLSVALFVLILSVALSASNVMLNVVVLSTLVPYWHRLKPNSPQILDLAKYFCILPDYLQVSKSKLTMGKNTLAYLVRVVR
jgi:hypothetical protein